MFQHQYSIVRHPARVVVLGAKGFVAGGLIGLLHRERIPYRSLGKAEVDLVESRAVEQLRDIVQPGDVIVVTSALTPEHGRDRATFLKNVAMIDHLCPVLAGVRQVIYISSDSVYHSRCTEINEESCCESNDMYALSHIVREKLLTETCQRANVRLTIIRPCAIYGARDTHNSYGPNRFIRTALREGKITLFGQGDEKRDHIYVGDLARLIQLCLCHGSSGVLNAATGRALSFHEVACIIKEAIDQPVVIETTPRAVPVVHRRFDTARVKRAFPDFKPTLFEAGTRACLAELSSETRDVVPDRGFSSTP